MKKKKFFFPFLALGTALIFLAVIFLWWQWASQPVSHLEIAPTEIFVVTKGESLTSVANQLEEEDLIRSSLAFRILVLSRGLAGSIQAGDFRLRPSLTTEEVAYVLTHGTLDVWLTFPEGWRREEIGRRLVANLESFNYQEFLGQTKELEGYLFPDTYLLPKEASPSAVIKVISRNFEKKFSSELASQAKNKGLTQKQVLILASIVEKEAKGDEDRALVAGILLKRWQNGWPLQADATVQYAKANKIISMIESTEDSLKDFDWWPKKINKEDLEIDSPYNTYEYKGLPPTPICNPGLASIKAVVEARESEYWFYLSDPSGKVHYARTAEEHNQNIDQYLK
jgi:UPF0755 protein